MDIYAIRELCEKYKIENYTIHPNGLVDVYGSVDLKYKDFISLPIKFGTVSGDFNCSYCDSLTSLVGAHQQVGGNFNCWNCASLTSLQGAPQTVGGYFDCSYCASLTSLVGAPKKVGGYFNCSNCNSLTSLNGAPKKVGGDFDCRNTSINIKGLVLINAEKYNDGAVEIPKNKYEKLAWVFK